ncbi:coiled-coil domain-containing protein 107 [Xenopus laevis]|uniref:Resistance to inhibitors of cholinesterase protein 3 N-terminal domain-containing protein n=2 Tax=Xenopus laevis TaxID=8355 RepID=A0AA97PYU0_XENLA|nr:coiled-coil domain-containing protein 107 [Xenopus laevis]OCT57016.1 hypothetical protein XELAEV_18004105mg [Xenopus laevis]
MALSVVNQLMIVISLALVVVTLMPRIFGGVGTREVSSKQEQHKIPPVPGLASRGKHGKANMAPDGPKKSIPNNLRRSMEQEIKTEKMNGRSHGIAFTLMPFYAIGVALFAAFKFTKINTKENNQAQVEEEANKRKAKETENQLVELERHLLQTENMLNSLLSQLDPLSNCVTTIANGQKDEIMNQLQQIRQLMKKTGVDKCSANDVCKDLEDIEHCTDLREEDEDEKESEGSLTNSHETNRTEYVAEEDCNNTDSLEVAGRDHLNEDAILLKEGLRKRIVTEL